ncbi:S-layer homology domain-containing protein, partial [Sporomusa sp.]|uniref:S-layer homology domain-containing protein n=1 Tax=Sporomusa sp. TaxID=2078658 RepID=UPI002C6E07F4
MKKTKKWLAIIPLTLMSITMAGTPALTNTAFAAIAPAFSDVPAGHWAYEAVAKLAKEGIVDGYSDKTFQGNKTLSRYEFAFIVAKAMDKFDAADEANKQLIDKLSSEFAGELNRLGGRVAKVEAKTNTWLGGETRMRYLSNDPALGKKLNRSDQFDFRQRIKFWGNINEDVSWVGRISTSGGSKFGSITDPGTGSEIGLDIMNITAKNFLGFDSIRFGRSALDFYTTGVFGGPMNYDGVTFNKKLGDNVTFKGWTGTIRSVTAPAVTNNTSQLSTSQLGIKLADNLNVKTGYYWSNADQGDTSLPNRNAINTKAGYGYDSSKGWTTGFDYKIGKITVLGDYVSTTLDNATSGLPSNPKAWVVQVSNSQGPAVLYPAVNLVNPAKKGTDAWMVGYRSIDAGAIPAGAGGFDQTAVSNTSQPYNVSFHGTDNVKVVFLGYQNVVAKNVIASLEYQDFKIKNQGLTTLPSDKLDKTYMMKFEFF